MNIKKPVSEFKEEFISSIEDWADSRIDGLADQNPRLSTTSIYLKNGVHNYLAQQSDEINSFIDSMMLCVGDGTGNIDVETVFNDILSMFNNMEELPFDFEFLQGTLQGTIGKGLIRIELPNNMFTKLLFGDTHAIRITGEDIIELKKMFEE